MIFRLGMPNKQMWYLLMKDWLEAKHKTADRADKHLSELLRLVGRDGEFERTRALLGRINDPRNVYRG